MKKKVFYVVGGLAVSILMFINAQVVFKNNSESYINLMPMNKVFASSGSSKTTPVTKVEGNGDSYESCGHLYIPVKGTTSCLNANTISCTAGTFETIWSL